MVCRLPLCTIETLNTLIKNRPSACRVLHFSLYPFQQMEASPFLFYDAYCKGIPQSQSIGGLFSL